MAKKIVLFGAGKIGRSARRFCKELGIDVSCFCDNSEDLCGTLIDGLEVISVERLKSLEGSIDIYITCASGATIYNQLKTEGFGEEQLHFYHWIAEIYIDLLKRVEPYETESKVPIGTADNVIFELSNGLALGGVETWVLQEVKMLNQDERKARVLYDVDGLAEQELRDEWKIQSNPSQYSLTAEQIFHIYSILKSQLPCTVICNFATVNFLAAVLVKHFFSDQVELIAVVHNDEDIYYEAYGCAEKYISKCMVISEKIKKRMQNQGMPIEKLQTLNWKIPVDAGLKRYYSKQGEALRLGYAGRITVCQKRLDLIVEVAEKLKRHHIKFKLSIAGTGNYLDEFCRRIQDKNLAEFVFCVGQVNHEKISDFWKEQDIMISCSEWEGHSISQCEAMAQGVVPILTDVSGARDDVDDGTNGFIVPVGAVDEIVNKVCYLNQNRDVLERMGNQAYECILNRNRENQNDFVCDD